MTMTKADAAALIEQDKQQRVAAALAAIHAVLREHECDLISVPQVTPDGRIIAVVQVVAR